MKEDITKSIRSVNYLIIIIIVNLNIIFYIFNLISSQSALFFLFNMLLLLIYYILNEKYDREYIEGRNNIKSVNNFGFNEHEDMVKDKLLKKYYFKENTELHNIFKFSYIKQNIMLKDNKDYKKVFSKFIPSYFMDEVGEKGIEKIQLGFSVKKELDIMFLDIVGFTTITETLEPERALTLLNIYFEGIVSIINKYGGNIDKFLGDGMLVIFKDKNSDSALKASIEIQNFMEKIKISEVGKKIGVGIGINSGEVILGIVGSSKRMEITIIGDIVNTAARIEGLTRNYNDNIIVSSATVDRIGNKKSFTTRELGTTDVKGKKTKIKIYGIDPVIIMELNKES